MVVISARSLRFFIRNMEIQNTVPMFKQSLELIKEPGFVHADLCDRNILIRESYHSSTIAAIIDADRAIMGDTFLSHNGLSIQPLIIVSETLTVHRISVSGTDYTAFVRFAGSLYLGCSA